MMLIIRLAAAVATLGLLSSIPAAGQAPKLSTQQLNPPTSNFKPIAAPNKPITVPKALTSVSPDGNKRIAAPLPNSPNLNKIAAPHWRTEKSRRYHGDDPVQQTDFYGQPTGGPDWTPPPNHGCPGGAEINPITGKCG